MQRQPRGEVCMIWLNEVCTWSLNMGPGISRWYLDIHPYGKSMEITPRSEFEYSEFAGVLTVTTVTTVTTVKLLDASSVGLGVPRWVPLNASAPHPLILISWTSWRRSSVGHLWFPFSHRRGPPVIIHRWGFSIVSHPVIGVPLMETIINGCRMWSVFSAVFLGYQKPPAWCTLWLCQNSYWKWPIYT